MEHGCFPRNSWVDWVTPNLAYAHQVHGVGIIEVQPGQVGLVGEADALVISQPGQAAMIKHTDCQDPDCYPIVPLGRLILSEIRASR